MDVMVLKIISRHALQIICDLRYLSWNCKYFYKIFNIKKKESNVTQT